MWASAGMIFSRIARSEKSTIAFIGTTATLTVIFSWLGVANWHVLSLGHIVRLQELIAAMVLAGLFNAVYQQLMLVSMQSGHNAIAWTIAQSAMVIPFLAGIIVWHDMPSLWRIGGVACLLAMIVVLGIENMGKASANGTERWLPLVLLTFLSVGLGQTFFSMPSRWAGWTDSAHLRLPISFSAAMVVNLGALLVSRVKPDRQVTSYALLYAALALAAQKLLFACMDMLAHVGLLGIAYPLAAGVCILAFALYSAFILKEKFKRTEMLAMAIGMLGLGMLVHSH